MALIYLCGLPGAGKSTVGKVVAEMRGSPFLDLDLEIERVAGRTIPAIFQSDGQEYFRRLESLCLQDALALADCVIALGGGTLESERNLNAVKERGKLIYLRADAQTLADRIINETHRPLLADASSQEEVVRKLEELLLRRKSNYGSADIQIDTTQKSPEAIASEIYCRLK